MRGTKLSRNPVILADSTLAPAPDARWLDPQWWATQGAIKAEMGGRGAAYLVDTPTGPAVLRRYLRGGWMAPLMHDRHLRLSADRSRGFREFRLLGSLRELHLPVPQPLAVSFEPVGVFYRAGLLTRLIPQTQPLAQVADELSESGWRELAAVLKRFFKAGLVHPDLNAHNLLIDAQGQWHMLDFDRAALDGQPVSGRRMIDRLQRSLNKHAGRGWGAGFEILRKAAC